MNKSMFLGACVVSLGLQITAITTSHWGVGKNLKNTDKDAIVDEAHTGLWKICVKGNNKREGCVHLPPSNTDDNKYPKNSLRAVQVFSILGALLNFAFIVLCLYGSRTGMGGYKKVKMGLLLGGGFCTVLASVIWGAELLDYSKDPTMQIKLKSGYSMHFNTLAGIFLLICSLYYKNM
jgi:PMP-22/EMP/MP20/Claudin family